MLYRFVDEQKAEFQVGLLCKVCEIPRSSYNDWVKRSAQGPTEAELCDAYLVNSIFDLHVESKSTYGSPRMTPALRTKGYCVNHKRVERLMREANIVGLTPKRRLKTTISSDAGKVPDLVNRNFVNDGPDLSWCGDITYIRTWEGWLYLATVIDLGSRRVLGWSMAEHMKTTLVTDALTAGLGTRGGTVKDVIFHSDRGTQYTSDEFAKFCGANGISRSVGRTGVCWDNAAAESFFASLKKELVHRRTFKTRAEARLAIMAWIEGWYNTRRLHSTLGYLSPIQWEQEHQLKLAVDA